MDQIDREFGQLNPNAPAALARFAFLIGRWRCEAKVRSDSGVWQTFDATWVGRFILDGYAIADEYRMVGSVSKLCSDVGECWPRADEPSPNPSLQGRGSQTESAGELIVLGVNLRTYDPIKQVWNIKWLNALAGTWVDLGPEELGGVRFEGGSPVTDAPSPRPSPALCNCYRLSISHNIDAV